MNKYRNVWQGITNETTYIEENKQIELLHFQLSLIDRPTVRGQIAQATAQSSLAIVYNLCTFIIGDLEISQCGGNH